MEDAWDTSPMTGDQCAICEAPLDEQSALIEAENGAVLKVCGACAVRFAAPAPEASTTADDLGRPATREAAVVQDELRELIQGKEKERDVLDQVALLLTELTNDLTYWQSEAAHLENRLRAVEGDLSRTRERLQRTEAVLSAPSVSAQAEAVTAPPRPTAFAAEIEERQAPNLPGPEAESSAEDSGLTLDDIRAIQRFFNESSFTEKMKSIRRSLGRPVVNVAPVRSTDKAALVTMAWEIVWYQYLVKLQMHAPEDSPEERVSLFAEGMELGELSESFTHPNAILDDQGRLDASEMEVSRLGAEREEKLLSTMSQEDEAALEDATEEIWDRHSLPEFRWDD